MPHLSRQVLDVAYNSLASIMITGVKIECLSIIDGIAEIRLIFIDNRGDDVVEIVRMLLRPGDTAVMNGLERALTVHLS